MDLNLAALPISELRKTEEGLALLREAVVQTALAYYYKKRNTQYEKASATVIDNIYFGPKYRHCDAAPEYAEWDTRYLNLCRGFTHDVYHAAFCDENGEGLQTFGGNTIGFNSYHGCKGATLRTGSYPMFHDDNEPRLYEDYVEDGLTHDQAVDKLRAMLQPGDIIDGDAHILLCIGDALGEGRNDLLHCWPTNGGSMKLEDGEPKFEPTGAITCQSLDAALYSSFEKSQRLKGIPRWCMYCDLDSRNDFGVHRPYMDKMYDNHRISPAAITRIKFRGISLSKVADRSVYSDVAEGETFTVTETVTNYGKAAFEALPLTEFVPDGTTLIRADGAAVDGNRMNWKLTVAAGASVTVSYVLQNNKKIGELITVPAGKCDEIPTRTFALKVGKRHYTEAELAAFEQRTYNLAAKPELLLFEDLKQLKNFYAYAFGFTPRIPDTTRELVALTMQKKPIVCDEDGSTVEMLVPAERTEKNGVLLDQIPNLLLSGRYVHLGKHLSARIAEYREIYFTPGDIIVTYGALDSPNTTELADDSDLCLYVYLGENRVVYFRSEKCGVALFSNTIAKAYTAGFFVTLRPTMID